MVTVQNIVRHELGRNPILLEMLQQDLLNVSAVAEKMQPKIQDSLIRQVKITAISMAIRRLSQELSKKQMFSWRFPENTEIATKSDIYEVAVRKEPRLPQLLAKLNRAIPDKKGSFLSIVEGSYETVFLTNQSNKAAIKSALKGRKIVSERDHLGYIAVNFEPYTKDVPGIYYQLTRSLAFGSISIQSLHTIGSEMVMLFRKKDMPRAYESVRALIENRPLLV